MTALEGAPFARDLGVTLRDDAGEHGGAGAPIAIELPFEARNTMYGHLHGGALAALIPLSTFAAMRELSPATSPAASRCTVSLHLEYLRAARKAVVAETRALRRVRELGFFETRIADTESNPIAFASSTVSELSAPAFAAAPTRTPLPLDETSTSLTHAIAAALARSPYLSRRGITLAAAVPSTVDLSLPASPANLDAWGRIHEGAALSLIDAAGATCPWTIVPSSTSVGGVTIALHAQIFGALPASSLIARATIRARNARLHWVEVTVTHEESGSVHALGTVVYRLNESS